MDISVKNALDKLLAVCESVEPLMSSLTHKTSLKELVAKNTFEFIFIISKSNAFYRYDCFNDIYQSGQYPSSIFNTTNIEEIPVLFVILNQFTTHSLKNITVRPDEVLISFFSELGKHYLLNRLDKKDIDAQKYISYIKKLQQIVMNDKDSANIYKTSQKKVWSENKFNYNSIDDSKTDNNNQNENKPLNDNEPTETLEELLEKLNALIGLAGVKNEVNSLINLIKI
jgi:hypothetical protein